MGEEEEDKRGRKKEVEAVASLSPLNFDGSKYKCLLAVV